MAACAMAELPPPLAENASMSMAENMYMPIAREHTSITINMGGIKIGTSLEELSKKLEEDMYKRIRCELNKTL